jgi:hypothetical protein
MSGADEAAWLRSSLNDANIEITNLKANLEASQKEVVRLMGLVGRLELYDQLGRVLQSYSEEPTELMAMRLHGTIMALLKDRP